MWQLLTFNLLLISGLMTALWVVSVAKRDASIIDPFWGLGFVVVAWATFLHQSTISWVAVVLTGAASLWGLRLFGYLSWRNWNKGEDRRYGEMRKKHGPRFWWVSLFTVFLLQSILLWVISFPIQIGIAYEGSEFSSLAMGCFAIGVVFWLVGFFFETVGDAQMAAFKADPENAGQVMDRGLWKYTRHPNYFGDFCVWWGYFLMATAVGGWWTVFSPLLMTVLLMKVSGVSLLEKDIEDRRPGYAQYKKSTSDFFPWFPSAK